MSAALSWSYHIKLAELVEKNRCSLSQTTKKWQRSLRRRPCVDAFTPPINERSKEIILLTLAARVRTTASMSGNAMLRRGADGVYLTLASFMSVWLE